MEITGKSNETYNFDGVFIDADITKAAFYNKSALIVICYFDRKLPVGSINYSLTPFQLVTKANIDVAIQDVYNFFNTHIADQYSDKKPNYIGFYTDGDLEKVYNDIIEGSEYKRTFKILS